MQSEYRLAVLAPFRLDLTVGVLRRLSSNVVDILMPDGRYLRALNGSRGPIFVNVEQVAPTELLVRLDGDVVDHAPALARVGRMLGVDRNLAPFYRAAARVPWLRPLASRMLGVKPPRYPTLWEACVNAVTFQQISLQAASAILRRFIDLIGTPLACDGITLRAFPEPREYLVAAETDLRGVGLSTVKVATLRRIAESIASGALDEGKLEHLDSAAAIAELSAIKGIGVWTATVILLRGFGRLDVFPGKDSGVARSLAFVAESAPRDIEDVLRILGNQRGLLYYHLLLARLEAKAEIGRPLLR